MPMPMPISSPVAPPLAAMCALGFLAALSLIGHRILTLARLRPGKAVVAVPLSLSVGTTLTGVVVWTVAALVGTTAGAAIAVLLLAFGLTGVGPWWRDWGRFLRRIVLLLRGAPLLGLALAVPLVMLVPQLLLPVLSSDGLRYHLALPKLYLLTGQVIFYPWDVHAAFPQTAEAIYMLALPIGGGEAAKLLHAAFFVCSLAVLMLVVHDGRKARRSAVAAAFFYAVTPAALAAAGAAFIDHFVVFHLGVACLLIRGRRSPLLIGCALAGAMATKWAAAPGVAGLALVVLWTCYRGGNPKRFAWLLLPLVVAVSPYALRNLVATGDPVFPTGYGLVRGAVPGVESDRFDYVTQVHREIPGPLGIPWGESVGEVQGDEVVGWHHLLGLILLPLGFRRRLPGALLALVLAYLAVGIVYHPSIRLSLPLFWALAACEGRLLGLLARSWWQLAGLVLTTPALMTATTVLWGFGQPIAYLSGEIDADEVRRRTIPAYDAAVFVNAQAEGGTVMAVDFPAPFLLDRPWIVEGILNTPPLEMWVAEASSADELLQRLRAHEVRFLVVTPPYGGGTPRSLLPLASSDDQARMLLALRSRLEKIYSEDAVDVYLITADRR